jgi:CRISPR-associated protein Cas1
MEGRVVEISGEGRFLKLYRGFLIVESRGEEVGRVPLDDIEAVLLNGYGATVTQNLMGELAARGLPLVICGTNHSPLGLMWGLDRHHQQGRISQAQAQMREPKRKQLWQQIVKEKIGNQAKVLKALGRGLARMERLSKEVLTGDRTNCEAQAAALYWPQLFGRGFVRNREEPGINALLNYGYTILRSTVSRAICCSGLLPVLPLHHHNRYNAMPLADDLMEPWRPLVDLAVFGLVESGEQELSSNNKKFLVEVLQWDLETEQGTTPLRRAIELLATSLAQCALEERVSLQIARYPSKEELFSVLDEACANSAGTE